MPPSERDVSKELEAEAKIERMLKKNPNKVMARYFHRIDVIDDKLDEHLKFHGRQWSGVLGKIVPHIRDIVLVIVVAVTAVLTGKVVLYP